MITDYLEVPLRNCLLSRPSAFLRLIRAVFLPLDHVNTAGRSHAHIEMVRSECSNLLVKTLILDLPSAGIESTILILKVATLRFCSLFSSQGSGRTRTGIWSSLRFAACTAIFFSVSTRMSEFSVASWWVINQIVASWEDALPLGYDSLFRDLVRSFRSLGDRCIVWDPWIFAWGTRLLSVGLLKTLQLLG